MMHTWACGGRVGIHQLPGHKPPYRPKLKGYCCVRLESGYEYEDARCARRGHPKVALRWQTGS